MTSTLALQASAAFVALFVTDLCWAVYIEQVKQGAAAPAALWSVFLFLTGASAVISYTANPWLLIPAAAGAFCGTYWGVRKNAQDALARGEAI